MLDLVFPLTGMLGLMFQLTAMGDLMFQLAAMLDLLFQVDAGLLVSVGSDAWPCCVSAGNDAFCIQCSELGNVSEQLFCTSCGQHYHGNCLCPPVEIKPIVRAGWQCPNCKICQTCRSVSLSLTHTHTHTYVCTHTHTHIHMYTHTYTHTHTHTHQCSRLCTSVHTWSTEIDFEVQNFHLVRHCDTVFSSW